MKKQPFLLVVMLIIFLSLSGCSTKINVYNINRPMMSNNSIQNFSISYVLIADGKEIGDEIQRGAKKLEIDIVVKNPFGILYEISEGGKKILTSNFEINKFRISLLLSKFSAGERVKRFILVKSGGQNIMFLPVIFNLALDSSEKGGFGSR